SQNILRSPTCHCLAAVAALSGRYQISFRWISGGLQEQRPWYRPLSPCPRPLSPCPRPLSPCPRPLAEALPNCHSSFVPQQDGSSVAPFHTLLSNTCAVFRLGMVARRKVRCQCGLCWLSEPIRSCP